MRNKFQAEWFEIERVLAPAVRREKEVDSRKKVDWHAIEQSLFGAALCAGCSIIEKAGQKGKDCHIKNMFELRNAFVHNSCDLKKNDNKNAFPKAQEYLVKELHKELNSNFNKPFYDLLHEGGNCFVIFNSSIFLAITSCLIDI